MQIDIFIVRFKMLPYNGEDREYIGYWVEFPVGSIPTYSPILFRRCYMSESKFQKSLIKDIHKRFPGSVVLKNDPNYIQGIPDLLVLYKDTWFSLECKKNANAKRQPNQQYYVDLMNKMSFSRFICPENKDEVLKELKQVFIK